MTDELDAFPLTAELLDLVEARTDPDLITRVQILLVVMALDHLRRQPPTVRYSR